MLVRPAGSSIVVNEEQPRKVLSPMLVELAQQATVKSNNQMLKFLEDASEKNCKMLKENCETIQEITTGGLAQDR
jgi:hypothetical protein